MGVGATDARHSRGPGVMLERIVPSEVVVVEAREDAADAILFPAEEAALVDAVPERRREFTTTRACAHAALRELGVPAAPITAGTRGEPRWPAGVVGSMTHCDGYRACAVASGDRVTAVGIDAEPHAVLPDGVVEEIARAEELVRLQELRRDDPDVHWDRLLFSIKESVYKAWFPLAKGRLGFEDASVTIRPHACTFWARLLVPGPSVAGRPLTGFAGSWLVAEEHLLTAVVLTR